MGDNVNLEPKTIFDRFIEKISMFNIARFNDWKSWTREVTLFFRSWGESLGFDVGCRRKYGGEKEYMTIDLVWVRRGTRFRYIDLALENENYYFRKAIERDELQKLLDLKSLFKVLVIHLNWNGAAEMADLVAREIRSCALKLDGERYLLMVCLPGENKGRKEPFVRIKGYVFDNLGAAINEYDSGTIQLRQNE